MRALIVSVAFSIVGVVTTVQAQNFGDIRQGRRIALDICASCHAVRASEILSPDTAAPSFRAIAHTPGMTAAALTVWLTAHPHHSMPYLILSGAAGSRCVGVHSEPPGLACRRAVCGGRPRAFDRLFGVEHLFVGARTTEARW